MHRFFHELQETERHQGKLRQYWRSTVGWGMMLWNTSAEGRISFPISDSVHLSHCDGLPACLQETVVTKTCFLCHRFCFPYRSVCWLDAALMWLWLRCPHGCVDPWICCYVSKEPGTCFPAATQPSQHTQPWHCPGCHFLSHCAWCWQGLALKYAPCSPGHFCHWWSGWFKQNQKLFLSFPW